MEADIVTEDDLASDPLRGINVDAAGGASKVLKMLAEKVSYLFVIRKEWHIADTSRL